MTDRKHTRYCSFCAKDEHKVIKLIAGPAGYICDECVLLCCGLILESSKPNTFIEQLSEILKTVTNNSEDISDKSLIPDENLSNILLNISKKLNTKCVEINKDSINNKSSAQLTVAVALGLLSETLEETAKSLKSIKPIITVDKLQKQINAVARVLCKWRNGKRSDVPFEQLSNIEQWVYLDQAAAVVSAMRE